MADIDNELRIILNAEYGEEVRTAIHDAIDKINQESHGGSSRYELIIDPITYEFIARNLSVISATVQEGS